MPLAVRVGAVATPLVLVVEEAVVSPPRKVPLAPLVGAVKVTVMPLTGLLLESFTVAARAFGKLLFIAVLCGVPAVAVTLAGGPVFTARVKLVGRVRFPAVAVTVMV